MAYEVTYLNPIFSTGKFGNCLSGGYGVVATQLPQNGTYTIEAWVNNNVSGSLEVFAAVPGWGWVAHNSNGTAFCSYGGGGRQISTNAQICDGNWHHVAMVVGTGGGKIFVDGILAGASAYTYQDNGGGTPGEGWVFNLNLRKLSDSDYIYSGKIDEVAVFNYEKYTTTFTPETIPYTGSEDGLVCLAHLDNNFVSPSFSITNVYSITDTSAIVDVSISSQGASEITERGLVYGETPSPTILDNKIISGSGIGTFSSNISGLSSGTTYYIRAYVINTDGTFYCPESSVTTLSSATTTRIQPNDVNIVYSPYNWKVSGTLAKTINAGAYLRFMLNGQSLSALFDLSTIATPLPEINYRIDGRCWNKAQVASSVPFNFPLDTQSWSSHIIEIHVKTTTQSTDRWNTQQNAVKLIGLDSNIGAQTLPIGKLNNSVIYFGDSITEGNLTLTPLGANDTDASDSTLSWVHGLSSALGVEYCNCGFGSHGFFYGGAGNVPPLISSYKYMWSGEIRDFVTVPPKLIVVNMGTNDGNNPITSTITEFLNSILAEVSCKIIMIRPFSGSQAQNIQDAISSCDAPDRVVYVNTDGFFNTAHSSDGTHPYGFANIAEIAPKLANLLQQYLYTNSDIPVTGFSPADFWNYLTSNPVVPGSMMERILNSASADFVGEIIANN